VQLSDKINAKISEEDEIYSKIFNTLEAYVTDILPIKLKMEKENTYKNIINEYERYEEVIIGKLDIRDKLKKQMALLGLSRFLFTHSLPLIAAEECYIKLVQEGRELLIKETGKERTDKTFELITTLIEEYNIKIVSTKVYWENSQERDEYKKFWDKYKLLKNTEEEQREKKQILFLKYDLRSLNKKSNQYTNIIKVYKNKLVELGAMRELKNTYRTAKGKHIKKQSINVI
jgi:hypothetical protein